MAIVLALFFSINFYCHHIFLDLEELFDELAPFMKIRKENFSEQSIRSSKRTLLGYITVILVK